MPPCERGVDRPQNSSNLIEHCQVSFEPSVRSHRERRPLVRLHDYVCTAIAAKNPDSLPQFTAFSGTSHPLSRFITYDILAQIVLI